LAQTVPALAGRRAVLDAAEWRRLVDAAPGTRRELAARLGLSERTLYRRLKALGRA
jgi:transcriptional regulator of acetoin/glycerol metabolism